MEESVNSEALSNIYANIKSAEASYKLRGDFQLNERKKIYIVICIKLFVLLCFQNKGKYLVKQMFRIVMNQ